MNEWTDTLLTNVRTLGFTLCVIQSMGLDKCLLSCVHHYRIIRNGFTALKICASAIHPSLSPSEPLVASDLFISIVLPFPDGPIVEIIQCMGFSDCIISWLNNSFPFFFHHWVLFHCGLPRWLSKEFTCQCRRPVFNPWVRKIPQRRKWQPIPVFLPGKSHRQRTLVGYSPRGHKESDTTQRERCCWASFHALSHHLCIWYLFRCFALF